MALFTIQLEDIPQLVVKQADDCDVSNVGVRLVNSAEEGKKYTVLFVPHRALKAIERVTDPEQEKRILAEFSGPDK